MKIAVCFRGEIRTGAYAIENIKRFIGNLLPHCDFFAHTWDVNGRTGLRYQKNEDVKHHWKILPEEIECIKQEYSPKMFLMENYIQKFIETKQQYSDLLEKNKEKADRWFIPRFYSWYRVNELKKQYENSYNFKYDYVFVPRFDNIFSDKVSLQQFIDKLEPGKFGINGVFIVPGANLPSADDMFFLSSSKVMDQACEYYFHRLEHAVEEDKGHNPEAFDHIPFYKYLQNKNLGPIDLECIDFSSNVGVLREECLHFNAVTQFHDCRICDKLTRYIDDINVSDYTRTLYGQDDAKMLETARRIWKLREYLPPMYQKFKDNL